MAVDYSHLKVKLERTVGMAAGLNPMVKARIVMTVRPSEERSRLSIRRSGGLMRWAGHADNEAEKEGRTRMDDLFLEMVASLREGQRALDAEVQPLLHAADPDLSMLARLRDVADDYAERARQLRQMMTEGSADEVALEEVNRLCAYFDGTAGLISQETGNNDKASTTGVEGGAGRS